MIDYESYIEKMTDDYDNFVEAIEIWEEKPTTKNKKKVIEKQKKFNATKTRIMTKIRNTIWLEGIH